MGFELVHILIQTLQQGLIYSLAVLGFAFSLRMLAYADLTLEGSFVLGGVMTAIVLSHGLPVLWAFPLALVAGILAGLFTAFQHCFLRINKLLSGIITLAILYSLNLRFQGRPNESFYGFSTVYDLLPQGADFLLLIIPTVLVLFLVCWWLLNTEWGLFLRACGENEKVVTKAGYSRLPFLLIGLSLGNGLIALSGCLFSQYMGFSDVNISGGLIVVALTSLILGEILFRPTSVTGFLLAIVVGSILCQLINTICLYLNLHPSDHKGIVGVLLIGLVYCRRYIAQKQTKKPIGAEVF